MENQENNMKKALKALRQADGTPNISQLARQYDVPYQTLRRRAAGGQTAQAGYESQQIFTPRQEQLLEQYIIYLAQIKASPTAIQVRQLAAAIEDAKTQMPPSHPAAG